MAEMGPPTCAFTAIWLHDRIIPANIDRVISTEIPDPELDPLLYDI